MKKVSLIDRNQLEWKIIFFKKYAGVYSILHVSLVLPAQLLLGNQAKLGKEYHMMLKKGWKTHEFRAAST